MGRLDDIQTAIQRLKKWMTLEYIIMIILGLAESFKAMNRPDPTLALKTMRFSAV